jgi:hypothetical protein
MKHVLVELICLFNTGENAQQGQAPPQFCLYGPKKEGFHCLGGDGVRPCPHLGYCEAEHELAYAGDKGEVDRDEWIGFGGDLQVAGIDDQTALALWRKISTQKINEAYDQYMRETKSMGLGESSER